MPETLFRKFTRLTSTLLLVAGPVLATSPVLISSPALAQTRNQAGWCRSTWGPTDQRGAGNRLSAAKVTEAASLINCNGVHTLENLNLAEIARDKVYEFALIFTLLPLKGATGSPGNPIAVR